MTAGSSASTPSEDTRPVPVVGASPAAPAAREVTTPSGPARVQVYPARFGVPRATLVLGHGAGGTGSAGPARDLAALADRLPGDGIEVVLVDQPWRVAGRRVADPPAKLDLAWTAVLGDLRRSGHGVRRLVVGGRSAGARVCCRTAADTRADAVVCLAFPLHPPGRPGRSRAQELVAAARRVPVLVVQGTRDPFGRPDEVAAAALDLGERVAAVAVPGADHAFRVAARGPVTQAEALDVLVAAVRAAVLPGPGNARRGVPR